MTGHVFGQRFRVIGRPCFRRVLGQSERVMMSCIHLLPGFGRGAQ